MTEKKLVETQSREMFLIFRATPFVESCMAAAPLVATDFIGLLRPIKTMFLNEVIQFGEDNLSNCANSNF